MRSRTHVLILEDDPLVAFDLQELLEERGYSSTVAFTLEEAEEWLREDTPDAAIIDVLLEEEPCESIAAAILARRLPFLVHAGYVEDRSDLDPVFASAPWFTKPADYEAMLDCLRGLLGSAGVPAGCDAP